MKRILLCAVLLGVPILLPVNGNEPQTDAISGHQLTSDYNLKEPFDPKELRKLASGPNRDDRRLMLLILRAGIEKDKSFLDLIKRPELREARNVDLALSAYDYMLNKTESAFNRILAQLATEDIGADVDTIVVMQVLDEWDRTIRAFRKHFLHTDGTGASCKAGFLETRAYLYPKKYAEMRDFIEAPLKWQETLLPEK